MTIKETFIENPAAYSAAVRRNILANARKTWLANTPRALEIIDATEAGRIYHDIHVTYTEDFIGAMAKSLDTYGKLTEKQSAAVLKGIDARAARKAEWAAKNAALNEMRSYLGTVGEKITLTLTLKKLIQTEIFGHRFATISYVHICEDANQNVVVYKGNSNAFNFKEGDTFTVTATVKEHFERNGVKQTIIQRPKAA